MRDHMLFPWRIAVNHFRNEAHQQALATRLRASGGVQSAAVVSKDSAVPEVPPYQIPSHAMHDEIRTYAELQQQMHYALREQHPVWVEPDGGSPICHSYERRFAELLALFAKSGTRSAQT